MAKVRSLKKKRFFFATDAEWFLFIVTISWSLDEVEKTLEANSFEEIICIKVGTYNRPQLEENWILLN